MLLFSFVVEKVKLIYQCESFLHTVLGHSFYRLCGCPSISVRPQRKCIFGMSFSFSCLIRLQLFYRISTRFLPTKRFIRLTGKSLSDMSDASSPQDLSKIFSLPSSESLLYPHIKRHYQESSPQGLASNLEATMMRETGFLLLQRR